MSHRIAGAAVMAGAALCALAGGEAALRWLDGYRLTSIALQPARTAGQVARPATAADAKYIAKVPLAPGVDPSWYALEPPPPPPPAEDAQLQQRAARYPADAAATYFAFNHRYLENAVCGGGHGGPLPPLADFFYFEPIENSSSPTFRHLPHVNPAGRLVTNNFGWRGPDIALNRKPGVIRIAFVGASTTVDSFGAPFSHPELVGFWLNKWAAATGRPYSFEVINAGRSGIDSRSIAAIVRQELLPVDPDLVIFYEGANQFWPGQLMNVRFGRLFTKPSQTFRRRMAAEQYSAVVRRVLNVRDRITGGDGSEPLKPPYTVAWPAGVDEQNPDVTAASLPMDLRQVVSDLESMRHALASQGGELAISSFVWLVHDGMRLNLDRQLTIYRYLNDTYWPIRYALMRRMADFENRVFEKVARSDGLAYFDLAGAFPQDPDLFDDAIHMKYEGLRLQAWMYLQAIVPVVEAHVASGAWPRPAPAPQTVHPAFAQPERRLVTVDQLKAACS